MSNESDMVEEHDETRDWFQTSTCAEHGGGHSPSWEHERLGDSRTWPACCRTRWCSCDAGAHDDNVIVLSRAHGVDAQPGMVRLYRPEERSGSGAPSLPG